MDFVLLADGKEALRIRHQGHRAAEFSALEKIISFDIDFIGGQEHAV